MAIEDDGFDGFESLATRETCAGMKGVTAWPQGTTSKKWCTTAGTNSQYKHDLIFGNWRQKAASTDRGAIVREGHGESKPNVCLQGYHRRFPESTSCTNSHESSEPRRNT